RTERELTERKATERNATGRNDEARRAATAGPVPGATSSHLGDARALASGPEAPESNTGERAPLDAPRSALTRQGRGSRARLRGAARPAPKQRRFSRAQVLQNLRSPEQRWPSAVPERCRRRRKTNAAGVFPPHLTVYSCGRELELVGGVPNPVGLGTARGDPETFAEPRRLKRASALGRGNVLEPLIRSRGPK